MIYAYACGFFPSWLAVAGWFYAAVQRKWPAIAEEGRRGDAGEATALGFFYALFWPILLPIAYCVSGFAEHGWLFPGNRP